MTHYDFGFVNAVDDAIDGLLRTTYAKTIDNILKEQNMTTTVNNRVKIDVKDIREGDLIRVEYAGTEDAAEFRLTQESYSGPVDNKYFLLDRPKKIKWAKGTRVYATKKWDPWFEVGDLLTVANDFSEGDMWLGIRHPDRGIGSFRESEVGPTDIKPEPHPVGATRWVTEDHGLTYGKTYKRGRKVAVHCNRVYANGTRICVSAFGDLLPANLLSATPVEPAPVYVSVRKDALDELRSNSWSSHNTIDKFLKTVDE